MKITKENLKKIIQKELVEILDAEHLPKEDPTAIMRDMQKALGALASGGPDALTASNLETIQGLLDRLKAIAPASSPDLGGKDRWAAIERGVAPE